MLILMLPLRALKRFFARNKPEGPEPTTATERMKAWGLFFVFS